LIDCMKTLGNMYGNRFRHVIPSRLSSCRSMNLPVGANPHGSAEKVKLLLNCSHLEPQAVKLQRHRGDYDLE
jgi:hypothetical protein